MVDPASSGHSAQMLAIDDLVDRYLTALSDGGEPDAGALCREHPGLMPELADALTAARAVQAARQVAHERPLGSESESSSLGDDRDELRLPYQFGRFELLESLGEGGFGSVYRALCSDSQQDIAVKVLSAYHGRDPQAVYRFRSEAAIAQTLKHPHIVEVTGVGEAQGRHYLTMSLIEGYDLQKVSVQRSLPTAEALQIVLLMAEACHHAHSQGVVHRDIKPRNILIERATGKPLLTDFGLARRLDASQRWTATSQPIGTVEYMAPEQADSTLGPVGPASDVYSLGATLYFLLAGRPPFERGSAPTAKALMHRIVWETPVNPRKLNPSISNDVAQVCLACLEKMPEDRYGSAGHLAADLGGLLSQRRINLPRVTLFKRTINLRRRHPRMTLAIAGLMLLVMLGTAGSAFSAWRALRADLSAKEARKDRTIRNYYADMGEAQALWGKGEMARLAEVLTRYERPGEFDPRGFEWHFLRRQLAAPSPQQFTSAGSIWNRLSFDASGKRLAALDRNGQLVVWDIASGKEAYRLKEPADLFEMSGDGKYFVLLRSLQSEEAELRDAASGELVKSFEVGRLTMSMAIHPTGSPLITGNLTGDLFATELPTGKRLYELTAGYKSPNQGRSLDIQHGGVLDVAFNPDGELLATGMQDGSVQLWSIAERKILSRPPPPHVGPVVGVSFSPDGANVASQSWGEFNNRKEAFVPGQVKVWPTATGAVLAEFSPHPTMLEEGPLLTVERRRIPFGQFRPVFSIDGKRVFTTGDQAVDVWNSTNGKREFSIPGHDGLVFALAISRDGASVAGTGIDGTIRVWPTGGNLTYSVLCESAGGIHSFVQSYDGRRFAGVCDRGLALWVGEHGKDKAPDGPPTLRVWDAATGKQIGSDETVPLGSTVQFCGNEEVQCGDRRWRLTDDSMARINKPIKIETRSTHFASADNSCIVRVSTDGNSPELLRPTTNIPYASLKRHSLPVSVVDISPDAKFIATGGADKLVCLWSSNDGSLLHVCSSHTDEVTALAFCPDGSHLISGGMDRQVFAWSVETGERFGSFLGHRREISGICFSQNGARFATSSGQLRVARERRGETGEVRLWDLHSGQLCIELTANSADTYAGAAISLDGNRIYAAANALDVASPGRIVYWDTTSNRQ